MLNCDQAFHAAASQARDRCHERNVDISVEKFLPHDFEVILGVKYDPTFGPVVLCGLGGIFTEVLKDYALRLAPLTRVDAEDMLSSLQAFPGFAKGRARSIKSFGLSDRRAAPTFGLGGGA